MWELPFPVRLPPEAFFIWEPGERVGFLDPRPVVGELNWKRSTSIVSADQIYADVGPPNDVYPTHDYRVTSVLKTGKEITTAVLSAGPTGGFAEVRPFSLINMFLCLRHRREYADDSVVTRAEAAVNNVLEIYRFVSMDPLVRPLNASRDAYYTVVSRGDLPRDLGNVTPRQALEEIGRIPFGREIGVNRCHRIGLTSFDDAVSGPTLSGDNLRVFHDLVIAPHELELFHQLALSAVRRLRRAEHSLAVVDAQSAFESLVAVILSEQLRAAGEDMQDVARLLERGGRFNTLQKRLKELHRMAETQSPGGERFLGSSHEERWRRDLYDLRNRVVHEGVRSVSFVVAREAVAAGLHAIRAVQDQAPGFNRHLMWNYQGLDLLHLTETSGRLARIFEQ